MPRTCPDCGLAVDNEPKFCPGCGAPLPAVRSDEQQNTPADSAPSEKKEEKRVFVLRRKQYGDTVHFDEPSADDRIEKDSGPAFRANLSLYLSVFAIVLSMIAIAMVVIFAVLPANQQAESAPTEAPTAATMAPTQARTEPSIAGVYSMSEISGKFPKLYQLMLPDSKIEMRSDYAGSILIGSKIIGRVTLDRSSDKAVMMNSDCTYTFDGTVLTLIDSGTKMIYQKVM